SIVVVEVPPKYALPVTERSEEDALVNCCNPVQELACPRLSDAITEPVVGEIVSVPSELETALTVPPPPVPHAEPVPETMPELSICKHCVEAPPAALTIKLVVLAVPVT